MGLEQLLLSADHDEEKSNSNVANASTSPLPQMQMRHRATSASDNIWSPPASTPPYLNPESPSSRGIGEPDLDSYDYRTHNSLVQRMDFRSRSSSFFKRRALLRWVLTGVVAMFTAFVALGIWVASRNLGAFKRNLVQSLIKRDNFLIPFITHLGISMAYVFIAVVGVAFIEPAAIGSGIPQIKCVLNGLKLPRVVRVKTLLVKAIGVAFSVSGGLPIGIEGPMIHSGAICGAGISQGKSTTLGVDTSFSKFRAFRNDKEKRDFVAAGAAAGVSCAFGAPIGGVLFSLEEGSSWWSQKLTWRTFFCSMFAFFVLAMFTSAWREHSQWGHLSDKSMFTFGDFTTTGQNNFTYAAYELPFFILMGAFGGLTGALYNAVNTRITKFRQSSVSTPMPKIIEGLLTTLVISSISFLIPYLMRGTCLTVDGHDNTSDELVRFYCDEGFYNPTASLFLASKDDAIKLLFHSQKDFSYFDCFLVFFIIFWTSCWCYGLSVPSGLFVPTLFAGAGFGRIVGQLLKHHVSFPTVEPGTYALIGAAAVLGGMARMTISLTVILIEATGDIQYGLPIMATLMTSKWIGDFFNHGLYDIHIHLNGWQFLEYDPPPVAHYLLAADIMHPRPQCVHEVERAGDLYDLLSVSKHKGFPVVQDISGTGRRKTALCGLMLRKHICVLLQQRAFTRQRPIPFAHKPFVPERTMEKDYPHYPDIHDVVLTEEERDMYVDLTPYMSPAPHVVPAVAPATLVFRLYRTMGLRHIPVVSKTNEVLGMITRKDLTNLIFRRQLTEIVEQAEEGAMRAPHRRDDIASYSFVHNYLGDDEHH